MPTIPERYESLLERPRVGHLATVRPDGGPQVNAMWFASDGEHLRFTHTTKRQKYHNIDANPRVAMSINDRYDGPLTDRRPTRPTASSWSCGRSASPSSSR